MFNKKLLSSIDLGKYKKKNPYKKDMILDPMGQWKHPGKNTRIPSNQITMKGVNYPVLGIANTGQKQMMQPGREYNFPGADYVDEYPQMKKGGLPKAQKGAATYQDSLDVYNNALKLKAFYDSKKQFYNISTRPWYDTSNLKRQEKETYTYDTPDSWTPQQKRNFQKTKDLIKANKDSNIAYITDMITGALDPDAPALRYDNRIKPQSEITYEPYRAKFSKSEQSLFDKLQKKYNGMTSYGDPRYSTLAPSKQVILDFVKKNGYSQKDAENLLYKLKKENLATANTPGVFTDLPYYDPLAIKPGKLLTDDEIKKRVKKYGTTGIPQDRLDKLGLKSSNPPKNSNPPKKSTSSTVTKSPCSNPITTVINNIPEKIPFGKKLVGTDEETLPVTGKKCEYVKTINPIYEDVTIDPIKPPAIALRVDNGILPPLQQSTYIPQEPIEAPQYTLDPYTADRLRLSVTPGKTRKVTKRGRLFDGKGQGYKHTEYKSTKDLDFGKKEVTRLIPRIVQKVTGYDPEYFEGSYDEEGNYIPGELDYGNEVGGRMEFRGAASLQDLINQQKYAKEWEEYERKIDEREEQSKKKQEQGQAFKKGGSKTKYTSDIINSTNYLFAEHPLFKKKKQSKKRIYSPNAKYYQLGGLTRFVPQAGRMFALPPITNTIANTAPGILNSIKTISQKLPTNLLDEGTRDLLHYPSFDVTIGESNLTGVDAAKYLGDFDFKPYSEGWTALSDMKNAFEGKQWNPSKEDFFTDDEVENLFNKHLEYRDAVKSFDEMYPEEPGMAIMRALSGDTSRDELFSNLFPNAYLPNFRSKILSPEQSAKLNEIGLSNITFTNRGMLNKNSLRALTKGEDVLPSTYKDLLEFKKDDYLQKAPAKDVVMEYRGRLGVKIEDILKATPKQLETWRQEIVKRIYNQALERWKNESAGPLKGLDAYNQIINRTGSRNKYGGELPKGKYGYSVGNLIRKQFGGFGRDQSLSLSPYDLDTYIGASGNQIYNPAYSIAYNNPNLFKKLDVAGTPFQVSIGRPYNTDPNSLTNPSLDFGRSYDYTYMDPGVQQGPQEEAINNAAAQYLGKDVQDLTQSDLNKFAAFKSLGEIKNAYAPGKPINLATKLSFLGKAFSDQPVRGFGSISGGYNPEAGFWAGADIGGFGVISNKSPRTYFNRGLSRKGDWAIIPSLSLMSPAIRQKGIANLEQAAEYKRLLEKDIQEGTDAGQKYYGDQLDSQNNPTMTFNTRPEIKAQLKPFKKFPGILEGVIGANIDFISGGKNETMDKITTNINPYGKVSYSVPIQDELDRIKRKMKSIEFPDKKHYEDYVEEYENQPTEETPTETDNQINPPQIQLNPNGTVIGRGDCPEGYERPCEKCRCQKIKMPQMYTDKRGKQLFGNEPIRFDDGGTIELELTPEEIEEYRKGGYIVEDISVPRLQPGGLVKTVKGITEGVKNINNAKNIPSPSSLLKNISKIAIEGAGELLMGKQNREAIAKGNEWLNNWISHPVTQAKIQGDIFNANFNPIVSPKKNYLVKYFTPVKGDLVMTEHDRYINALELAKRYKPNVGEYSFKDQFKDLLSGKDQSLSNSRFEHIHDDNAGVTYMHQSDPISRELYKSGYYKPNFRVIDPNYKPFRHYGSFTSRNPNISPYGKESITIHEGTHDWITDYLLNATGQKDLILDALDPEVKKVWEKWKAGDKTLTKDEKNLGYYADPTEIHARIMQLRRQNDLTPFDMISDENSGYFMDQILSNKVPFNGPQFAKTIGNDRNKLAKLMNDLYGIALPVGVATGAGAMLANPYADESPVGKYQDGGIKKAIKSLIKIATPKKPKIESISKLLKLPNSPNAGFVSEINWANWNPETPNYPELITEYNAIEEFNKTRGTWMKNPDGTPYQGTPEQFIQEQSSHFKKAFPEGYNEVFRGVSDLNAFKDFTLSKNPNLIGDKAIFTADKNLAKDYAGLNVLPIKMLNPFIEDNNRGVYNLIYPKGKQITYNTGRADWLEINLSKNATKENLQYQIDTAKKHYERLKNLATKGDMNEDFKKNVLDGQKQIIENLQSLHDNFDNVIHDKEAFAEMRKVLGDITSTDAIAEYLPKTDLRSVTLQNIIDGGLGDVTIVNNRPGNYLKSRIGNVGFFNMNNPNIYKSLAPLAIGAGAGALMANPYTDESPIGEYQTGGEYQLGDEVDEATMKKLKKLGFTFEQI